LEKEIRRWKKRQGRLLRPKKRHLKKAQKKALWQWRLKDKTPSERKRFLKYVRRMHRYLERGQLQSGVFYCKAGLPITEERVSNYQALCHFMVRKFLPALALWEASMVYDDLINQCKAEVFLALLNGYDPYKVLRPASRGPEQLKIELQKLEQSTVFGRLKSYLRRTVWKNHPDQLGGQTWSMNRIVDEQQKDGTARQEFRYGLYTEMETDSLDFVQKQTDLLVDILESGGPDAARKAFFELDFDRRDLISESLFRGNTNILGEIESCG
jgi:hypothetical protein